LEDAMKDPAIAEGEEVRQRKVPEDGRIPENGRTPEAGSATEDLDQAVAPEEGAVQEGRGPAEDREAALRDQLLRLRAEFDNYRRRESRERLEAWSRAKADLIEKLLGSIDDLSRVAHPEGATAPRDSQAAAILDGVELVLRKMLQVLEREGLEAVEAEGAVFDPRVHEAVLTQPTNDARLDGRVAQVVLPGYRFADRLLRPAKVVVWRLRQ
jgi:molecular chaperone GrpE